MTSTLPERVATLEAENEACANERATMADQLREITATLNYVRGGVKVLVVLWGVAVAVMGLLAAFHWRFF
jgi:hypothetical protein